MKHWLLNISIALVCIGCSSTPSHVIEPEDMAQLLVDFHIGESIVEGSRHGYDSDSLKKTLKQSILLKHNVTAEQVDTSFMWYGQHIEEYIKVYDRVIELLEDDIASVKVSAEEIEMAVVGDSADAWAGLRQRILAQSSPSNYVSFAINRDENWEKGDTYQWRMKVLNNRSKLNWTIAVDYSDGSSEYNTTQGSQEGWQEVLLATDSTKTATRVYGVAHVDLKPHERILIDSISLIRTRLSSDNYGRRRSLRKFSHGNAAKRKSIN